MCCNVQFVKVKEASRKMALLSDELINKILSQLAETTRNSISFLLSENQKDLDLMSSKDPKYDRLLLTEERLIGIANDIENIRGLPSSLGKVLDEKRLDNGLRLEKVSVPLGTIGVIYEARPNVTFDVFALCFKSGNACVLKGSRDAENSNKAIVSLIKKVLEDNHVNPDILQLLPASREAGTELMNARDFVDVLIPRGSQQLINSVRENANIPVIETGAGIVHTYFDRYGDLQKGKGIIFNAKTRRVSVCNALDCLIVHKERLSDLYELVNQLLEKNVELYADELAYPVLQGKYPEELLFPADPDSFGTEFLAHKMSIKTVKHFKEALDHIYLFSSKHSEAIVSENTERIRYFLQAVDAAAVYANSSTAFTDGAQFGLGAEIGISTQKLHARGPMALDELTSYKWLVRGDGQVRN
ncbi:glutamate-5-semialdehyde dehydrogenase [Ancylomarina sp.]|uniref:glutamate-5-semialdehyde dehydrogenase n=1 Tax=Ancylomarina sp. TaxID=1970196 RepID=UPI0035642F09